MPFFVVDDGADSHPKMVRAKNAAVGLWMRVGSYVARHLTDGHVPGEVATMYGTPPQIRKLVAVALWHEHGHTCPRCPQPRPGDYYMHDYRESGNPSRAEVLARRAKAAAKKQRQRAGGNPDPQLPEEGSSGFRDGIDDEEAPETSARSDDAAREGDVSPGESPETSRGRAPLHSTPAAAEEEEGERGTGRSGRPPAALSLIPADWQPTDQDVAAAQSARADAGREQLTPQQLTALTRKFVRRQRDDGTRAAAWGGRWQQWAETERTDPPGGGGVVLPWPGGAQPTRGQQQREGLARLMQQTGEV
ncbi:hypothetical protein [Streptomyces chumphonensis]|uniref:hypothetical protein n=1 Tax=Streptomyces chumphonensis TaxID=1214925 RepID=UPI003D70F92E